MAIAILPARGGSKRISRKNIKDFFGKPMIAWAIETALRCKDIDRVVVSTDDEDIAAIARSFGADVPFRRPDDLANDTADTVSVICHAIGELGLHDGLVVCIYPATPLLRCEDIEAGLRALDENPARQFAFASAEYSPPIFQAMKVAAGGGVQLVFPEYVGQPTQLLEKTIYDAGQFYVGRTQAWINRSPVFSADSVAIPIPAFRAVDIDNIEDWDRAAAVFALLNNKKMP